MIAGSTLAEFGFIMLGLVVLVAVLVAVASLGARLARR